ncbi:hypothetical protein [Paenibacillus periandrae]|nr:hypothetical protein [Paenibacillus periandrae]
MLDLSKAVILSIENASKREAKATEVLIDEIAKRSSVTLSQG